MVNKLTAPGTTVFARSFDGEVFEVYVEENRQYASAYFDDRIFSAAKIPLRNCFFTREEMA